MLGVGVSTLLFEQTELMRVFLQIPSSTKHFPSEYYCNKHCPSGAPILHAEFLSTVQWDFWQELQVAYGISVLDKDLLLVEKTILPLPYKYVIMHGNYVRVSEHHSWFNQFQKNNTEIHQSKCCGSRIIKSTIYLNYVKSTYKTSVLFAWPFESNVCFFTVK